MRTVMRPHREPVTIERLERGLAMMAYLVMLHGPVLAPLFERLERELAAMRSDQGAVDRARKLLESYMPPSQRSRLGPIFAATINGTTQPFDGG
jgi:hypothetical protein